GCRCRCGLGSALSWSSWGTSSARGRPRSKQWWARRPTSPHGCRRSPGRVQWPRTRRLIGGLFEYADLGAVEIKGFAAPVRISRVLREGAAEGRFEAQHGRDLTQFVGRDEELALLQRRWQQAKSGEGWLVLVSGGPG